MAIFTLATYVHAQTCFFFIRVFFHEHSRTTGPQGKGKGISLTSHYHFHPLHRHLDISRAVTVESSPRHLCKLVSGVFWNPHFCCCKILSIQMGRSGFSTRGSLMFLKRVKVGVYFSGFAM